MIEEDLNLYREKKQLYDDDLKNHLNKISSFKEIRSETWGLTMRSDYAFIGNLCLFLKDVIEAKKYYYKAAKITLEIFKIVQNNSYPNLPKPERLPFTAVFSTSFIDAILSDSDELLKEFSEVISDHGNSHPPFNFDMTYALKYLILEDYERAAAHISQAHQQKYFKLPYKGFSHVVKGIIDKDIDLINEGITYRLDFHQKDAKGSIFYRSSTEITALVKLAIRFNLEPELSSSFIHKGLLEKHKINDYEGVEEILKALAMADRRNGSFANRLSGLFKWE